ncbi:arginase family protein [Liquorilactobacillus hordei]|uniref:arginase family protein n=1 Tax=Liquorilactobacillus hordei TaxID=468911 RepID=UPI0039EB51AD
MSKVIKLKIPDWRAGNRPEYYAGAEIIATLLNDGQIKTVEVPITSPTNSKDNSEINGVNGQNELVEEVRQVRATLKKEAPDKIITVGGNCFVSQGPFDYLHEKYGDGLGIIWIDAHPDISKPEFYNNEHAMVLGNLLGYGDPILAKEVHAKFAPKSVLFLGLQPLTDDEPAELDKIGLDYQIQDKNSVTTTAVEKWIIDNNFSKIAIHFDLDSLSPDNFRLQYFAEPHQTVFPSSHGKLTLAQVTDYFASIQKVSEIVGVTVAEFLPWDIIKLKQTLNALNLFNNDKQ